MNATREHVEGDLFIRKFKNFRGYNVNILNQDGRYVTLLGSASGILENNYKSTDKDTINKYYKHIGNIRDLPLIADKEGVFNE